MVTKQALASGLPVITSDHAGIAETFKDGVHGILIPERNAAALADALARLIEDPSLAAGFAVNGRKLVEETFNVKKAVARLEEIYEEALA